MPCAHTHLIARTKVYPCSHPLCPGSLWTHTRGKPFAPTSLLSRNPQKRGGTPLGPLPVAHTRPLCHALCSHPFFLCAPQPCAQQHPLCVLPTPPIPTFTTAHRGAQAFTDTSGVPLGPTSILCVTTTPPHPLPTCLCSSQTNPQLLLFLIWAHTTLCSHPPPFICPHPSFPLTLCPLPVLHTLWPMPCASQKVTPFAPPVLQDPVAHPCAHNPLLGATPALQRTDPFLPTPCVSQPPLPHSQRSRGGTPFFFAHHPCAHTLAPVCPLPWLNPFAHTCATHHPLCPLQPSLPRFGPLPCAHTPLPTTLCSHPLLPTPSVPNSLCWPTLCSPPLWPTPQRSPPLCPSYANNTTAPSSLCYIPLRPSPVIIPLAPTPCAHISSPTHCVSTL
ncbi:leucine-rich repeat extensin-like protein 5 [Penaeus monodon]|uniref:leucine-rich repeat extensin-like protein 5 n=1 Tax=Penaeus monodon TaxID=6687 RepID=UPI0018A70304|nr:leucine-rich repeat extensin-like protein 5 [Penaeus monodon]